jgi:Bifunctional DNA primase/polymerase, N-terminal/Primase C terminal 1 (PriCT-1)
VSGNPYLDAALTYARAGIPVFRCTFPINYATGRGCSCARREQCDSPAKHPLEKGGFHNATIDLAVIERSWARSICNIGIATGAVSGLIVLDVDPRHSGDETLAQLEAKYGELPATWRFLTGGGGEHILFAHPGGYIKSQSGALGPGLDIKADGGYIIAPPSEHISGRRYEISVDHHPEEVPLSPPSAWLIAKLGIKPQRVTGGGTHRDWQAFAREPISEGERNTALATLAGLLFRRLSRHPDLVAELVAAWNARWCSPPLDEAEVGTIVASIGRYFVETRGNGRSVPP